MPLIPKSQPADKKQPSPAAVKNSPQQSWWQLIKQTGADWSEDNCTRLAAALSCYTVLSLAPLVVIFFKVLGIVFRGPTARAHLQSYLNNQVQSLTGFSDNGLINTIIEKSTHPGSGIVATSVGVVILLFSASGVFGELQNSMNTIWEVKLKPNLGIWGFVRQRFLSMSMVLGVAFLLLVSLFVSTAVTTITHGMFGNVKVIGILTDVVLSLGVTTVLFAMIYKLLPDVKIPWKYVWLGALITAVLFAAGKWGLTLYFKYGSPTSAYGAFGSLAAVVIWVYYSAMILFFGAEFTKVYARAHGHKLEPTQYAVAMTEKDRVQQGIPHEQTVWNAVAQDNVSRMPPRPVKAPSESGTNPLLAAGAGLALGLLGALGYANSTKNRVHREIAARRVGCRIAELERRAGKASALRQNLARLTLAERLQRVERCIQHTARVASGARTARPARWTDRIAAMWH